MHNKNLERYSVEFDELKKILLQSRQDLEERLDRIAKHIRNENSKIDPDFEEQTTQTENDEVVNRLSDSLQRQLADVRNALKRMADGNYSVCSCCGDYISVARLTAIPFTSLCKKCVHEPDQT